MVSNSDLQSYNKNHESATNNLSATKYYSDNIHAHQARIHSQQLMLPITHTTNRLFDKYLFHLKNEILYLSKLATNLHTYELNHK